jgi:hypothetical protein
MCLWPIELTLVGVLSNTTSIGSRKYSSSGVPYLGSLTAV